ncbi:hypothetical protein [Haloterrigena salinisoli]|uniref:hypothetical protein n=1 Tax=Haloterrigena salinisoli TaxID=3132747 RepID=UPI0030CEED86
MDAEGGGISGLGSESTEYESESSEEVLQSMGYRHSEAEIDRTNGNSTGSWTEVLQQVMILALVGFLGVSFAYFLLTGILAIFGVNV